MMASFSINISFMYVKSPSTFAIFAKVVKHDSGLTCFDYTITAHVAIQHWSIDVSDYLNLNHCDFLFGYRPERCARGTNFSYLSAMRRFSSANALSGALRGTFGNLSSRKNRLNDACLSK
jgi:hypothetical protein